MSTETVTSISLDNGRVAYVQDPIEDVVARYKNALEIERDLIEVTDLKGNQGYIDSDAISTISLANIEPETDQFDEGVALVLNVIEDVIKDETFLPSETESPVDVILSITDSLGAILGLERESAGPESEFITDVDCEDCDCGFCQEDKAEAEDKSNRQELGDILVNDPDNADVILIKGAVLDGDAIYATESATWVRDDDRYEATPDFPVCVVLLNAVSGVFDLAGNKLDL